MATRAASGLVAMVALLAGVMLLRAQDDARPRIPILRELSPLAADAWERVDGPLTLRLRDVAFTTSLGARVRVPLAEVIAPAPLTSDEVHVESVRVVGLRFHAPPDSIDTPFDPFVEIPGPRVTIDRFALEDAVLETAAHPIQYDGEWLWRAEDVDLVLSQIRFGGGGTLGSRIARFDFVGEFKGRPLEVVALNGGLARSSSVLESDLFVSLGTSRLDVSLSMRRDGAYAVQLAADTLLYPEVRALVRAAPQSGSGAGVLRLSGDAESGRVQIPAWRSWFGASEVVMRGGVVTGPALAAESLVLETSGLASADIEEAFGASIPGGGSWRGALRAHGVLSERVAVNAAFDRLDEPRRFGVRLGVSGASDSFHVAGTFDTGTPGVGTNGSATSALSGSVAGDVDLESETVRGSFATGRLVLWDTAWVAAADTITAEIDGTFDAVDVNVTARLADGGAVSVSGRAQISGTRAIDAVAELTNIRLGDSTFAWANGSVAIAGPFDRAVARPLIVIQDSTSTAGYARVDGSAVLASDGALDLRVHADSLPLDRIPLRDAVRDVRGLATGVIAVGGTISEPEPSGSLVVRDGAFTIVRSGTPVDSLTGEFSLSSDAARVALDGRAGPGSLALRGSLAFDDPRTVTLDLRADSALLVSTDSAVVVGSATIAAAGPLEKPVVDGTIALVDGWIHEDNFKRQAPQDTAETRTIEESDEPPPFAGGVTVEIMPGIRIIDEDSEMRGRGTIAVTADSAGVHADGVYRIHEGFYANFGERFRVVGGAFVFSGTGVEPRVTLRAEHDDDEPLVSGIEPKLHAFEWQPPLEFFAIGTPSVVSETLRRAALLPESQTELASYLLTQSPTQPITGWRASPFWPANDGGGVAGARASAQSLPLLWAYIADEGYDYLPLSVGYLRAGTVEIGSEYPAPIVVGPLLRAAGRAGRWQALLSQPLAGWPAPGVRLRYDTAEGLELFVFNEPRYRPSRFVAGGLRPWELRRRSGIGFRWSREF